MHAADPLYRSVETLRQHVGRARHFDPVGREALARDLREMAAGLEGVGASPGASRAFDAANTSVASSVAVAEVAEMRQELRRLRDDNARISRQNDEILAMLRSMSFDASRRSVSDN